MENMCLKLWRCIKNMQTSPLNEIFKIWLLHVCTCNSRYMCVLNTSIYLQYYMSHVSAHVSHVCTGHKDKHASTADWNWQKAPADDYLRVELLKNTEYYKKNLGFGGGPHSLRAFYHHALMQPRDGRLDIDPCWIVSTSYW